MALISARGLTKSYGKHNAVTDVSFDIGEGETVAMLGPNGAGKTTTVEILEGFRERTRGEIRVIDEDPWHAPQRLRAQLGFVLQATSLEAELSVLETLQYYRALFPNPRPVDEVLAMVGLESEEKVRVGQLSGGQQRRVDLAVGIIGNPRVLFLDEPTTGLDPIARRQLWGAVRTLKAGGTTVLLTTHYLEEAQELADTIMVLSDGKLVAHDSPANIVQLFESETHITFRAKGDSTAALPTSLAESAETKDGLVTLKVGDVIPALKGLLAWADRHHSDLAGLTVNPASLEETYLNLIRQAEEGTAPPTKTTHRGADTHV
ncbi:ABC transporter ATP-binding protein [Amycolatopsis samaneae]|uniref:ABC transporter ATP-binding protein n=1 Tax=Amycolatopsis samaneae TaxID=664691 RepID=A0ABW5GP85_9PSEU